jgi:hypothetical protein
VAVKRLFADPLKEHGILGTTPCQALHGLETKYGRICVESEPKSELGVDDTGRTF